jgi:Flp pilus assembly protein CpaB
MGLSRLGQVPGVWPRRLIALACLLLAGLSALHADRPSARADTPTAEVVIAARDLLAGTVVGADDERSAAWPASLRPATALAQIHNARTDASGRCRRRRGDHVDALGDQ